MRHRIYGAPVGRHVALIGVWDPILPAHEELFRAAIGRADSSDRKLLVVTLDPPPVAQLRGHTRFPAFHDVAARQFFQEDCGVQTRIKVSLSRAEVSERGADWLLSCLCQMVCIEAFELGAAQSLGRGPRGSSTAVREFCDARGIAVRTLPAPQDRPPTSEAREHLRAGRLCHAVSLLASPLYWSRPRAAELRLPWPPGPYRASPVAAPARAGAVMGAPFVVELEPHRGTSRLRWPNPSIPWLAFSMGPADLAAGAREAA